METLDLRGLRCPLVVRLVARRLQDFHGETLEVLGDDPTMEIDLRAWAEKAGWQLHLEREDQVRRVRLTRLHPATSPALTSDPGSQLPDP
jgi:TusA-related sulfurtransferase